MLYRLVLLTAALALLSAECGVSQKQPAQLATLERATGQATNIVFLIGDGMGLSQITAGMYANGNRTVFERFPFVGLIKTHAKDNLITDSAAGATAFSTGEKTYNGAISVDMDKKPLPTIFEEAEDKGMQTGLAVTSTITHATPACYYAHDDSRYHNEAIALDLSEASVDVAIGYGREQFTQREDGLNLLDQMKMKGTQVWERLDEGEADAGRPLAVILPGTEPPKVYDRGEHYLRNATQLALDQLSASEAGFMLVVEGSQIDWAGHSKDADWIVDEMIDFDETIGAVLDWAERDGQTLVVVTADHETGGYALHGGDLTSGTVEGGFTTDYHTGTMVPVFAYGPGAERFSGVYENTGIHAKMREALGW